MATNYCKCDLSSLDFSIRDIVIQQVPFIYHGYNTARRLELDLLKIIDKNGFTNKWGYIHHCKLHMDPKANKQTVFLRFCNTKVHEEVIDILDGMNWPTETNNKLKFIFNRKITKPHQAQNRERLICRNASTQTEMTSNSITTQTEVNFTNRSIQTDETSLLIKVDNSSNQACKSLEDPVYKVLNLIDFDGEQVLDKYDPLRIESKAKNDPILNIEYKGFSESIFFSKPEKTVRTTDFKCGPIDPSKIKKNPSDMLITKDEFERLCKADTLEAWTRYDWDALVGLREVRAKDGSICGYSRKELEADDTTLVDLFSVSSSFILLDQEE
ncbi:unnamed protein product [Brachionus calyciflorus]|uniref:Uncharacterized protein n=1 Tax=Brachionus calyciflorus TaxID=104777 RepID=A0A814EXE0_9BILA|nr:unnamed protein product [Brachionus calyciflorus]